MRRFPDLSMGLHPDGHIGDITQLDLI